MKLPVEDLRNDRFTLVLIGAFQSGKSTLFNYFCNGRELSPVGPAGGGIRTSGCQVSAHALRSGESEEYAMVNWRSADDLLASLGDVLVSYYPECNGLYITSKDVNLYDAQQRKQMAEYAFAALKPCTDDSKAELLRFALIVAGFFEHFKDCLSKTGSRMSLESAVQLSSYPQDWKKQWLDIMQNGDISLSVFKPEQLSFAFCGGVEFYLNSPALQSLDCSVIDCPGLFVSRWDTDIAKKCICSANAILYMFAGEKSMSQEDVNALKTCVELGGKSKIIFGANLRKPRKAWNRILREAVMPELKSRGFDNPDVNNFHSGLALRTLELIASIGGDLPPMSEAAIDMDLALDEQDPPYDDDKRQKYLKKLIKRYIETLTDDDKSLSDFAFGDYYNFNSIIDLSGVQDFIAAATNHVLNNRYKSMLVDNGIARVLYALRAAFGKLEETSMSLQLSVEEAEQLLREEEEVLRKFNRSREAAVKAVDDSFYRAKGDVKTKTDEWIYEWWYGKFDEIKGVVADNLDFTGFIVWSDAKRKGIAEGYTEAMKKFPESFDKELRKKIKDLASPESFKEARDTFEWQRSEMLEKVESLRGIPSPAELVPAFPQGFTEVLEDLCLANAGDIVIQSIWPGDGGWGQACKNLWNYWTTSCNKYSEEITNKYLANLVPNLQGKVKEAFENITPQGLFKAMDELKAKFAEAFELPARQFEENINAARALLAERRDDASVLPAIEELKQRLGSLISEAEELDALIRSSC